jgi:hypothetical protein
MQRTQANALFCNGNPITISVQKSRHTNLQLWQGSSRLSRCPQGRPQGRQQQERRCFMRCSAKLLKNRYAAHGSRSRLPLTSEPGQGRTAPNLGVDPTPSGSHRLLPDALRFRCTPGARDLHHAINGPLGVARTRETFDFLREWTGVRARTPPRRSRQTLQIVFSRKCAENNLRTSSMQYQAC